VHNLLAAGPDSAAAAPAWFAYAAALLAALGPVGSLVRSFARAAEKQQLDRVQGLRTVINELDSATTRTDETDLAVLTRRHALRRTAENELLLVSAAYVESSARRPGSVIGGTYNLLAGAGIVITVVSVVRSRSVGEVAHDSATLMTLLVFGLIAVFAGSSGVWQIVRRLNTRRLRLASGLPDFLTREYQARPRIGLEDYEDVHAAVIPKLMWRLSRKRGLASSSS